MQRTRSCAGCPARSRRVASPTTWRAKCPAPPRSRPPGLPSALSSMSEMKSTLVTAPLAQIETPLLAIALAQGSTLPKSLGELDRAAGGGGVLARAVASGDFKGKRDESLLVYPGGGKAQRILLVGLGKGAEVTRSAIRRAAAVAAKRTRGLGGPGATQFAFAAASEARNHVAARDLGQAIVEGAAQGAWAFTEFKAAPEDPKPEVEAVAVACDAPEAAEVAAGQKLGDAGAAGAPPPPHPPKEPRHRGPTRLFPPPGEKAPPGHRGCPPVPPPGPPP